jgi:hypothetical protein
MQTSCCRLVSDVSVTVGNSVDSTWRASYRPVRVGYITHFDASDLRTRFCRRGKGFEPEKDFGHRETPPHGSFRSLLASTLRAVENSGLVIDANQS